LIKLCHNIIGVLCFETQCTYIFSDVEQVLKHENSYGMQHCILFAAVVNLDLLIAVPLNVLFLIFLFKIISVPASDPVFLVLVDRNIGEINEC